MNKINRNKKGKGSQCNCHIIILLGIPPLFSCCCVSVNILVILPDWVNENIEQSPADIHKFHSSPEISSCSNKAYSLLNCNIRSIQANFDNLVQFLHDLNYPLNIISLSETWLNRANEEISNLDLPGYSFLSQPTIQRAGGVGMYIKKGIQYSVRHDLTSSTDESEMLWVEIESD